MPPIERLPKRAAKLFIEDLLKQTTANGGWDPTEAAGYDPTASAGTDAFLPVATSISDVGAVYPSVVVSPSTESSGGTTTYDYLTGDGPAQRRDGQLVATARAEDRDDGGYTGDSATYSAQTAEAIVRTLIDEVEAIALRNHLGGGTDLGYVGSQRGGQPEDDFGEDPTVRIAQCVIPYGWLRG